MDSKEFAECPSCGAQQGNYQYCINCGHDALAEAGALVASARPADAGGAEEPTQSVGEGPATPGAKELAEQLAALVAAASKPAAPPLRTSPTRTGAKSSGPAESSGRQGARADLAILIVAGLLAVALTGVALGRAFQDQPRELSPSAGALVSAEDTSTGAIDAPERVACWDGSTVTALSQCGTPEGLSGLTWVFPSIKPEECVATGSVGRPQAWSCLIDKGGPNEASIVYGEFFSIEDGINHYDQLYAAGIGIQKTVGSRYVWKAKRSNVRGVWQRSSMYVDHPWSVHVEAATKLDTKQAYKSVEFRAPEQIAGLGPTE